MATWERLVPPLTPPTIVLFHGQTGENTAFTSGWSYPCHDRRNDLTSGGKLKEAENFSRPIFSGKVFRRFNVRPRAPLLMRYLHTHLCVRVPECTWPHALFTDTLHYLTEHPLASITPGPCEAVSWKLIPMLIIVGRWSPRYSWNVSISFQEERMNLFSVGTICDNAQQVCFPRDGLASRPARRNVGRLNNSRCFRAMTFYFEDLTRASWEYVEDCRSIL